MQYHYAIGPRSTAYVGGEVVVSARTDDQAARTVRFMTRNGVTVIDAEMGRTDTLMSAAQTPGCFACKAYMPSQPGWAHLRAEFLDQDNHLLGSADTNFPVFYCPW